MIEIVSTGEAATSERSLEVAVEINEWDEAFAVEALDFRQELGEAISIAVLDLLVRNQVRATHDDEVDALTFSFGDGQRSKGQRLGELKISFNGSRVTAIHLSE